MKKLICLLSILLMLTLLIPAKQADAFRGGGWILPGLIVGSVIGWSLAPRYYYPPAYYYPAPPPPAYYNPSPGEVSQIPPPGGQLFIYPRQGQSQEKLVKDRNECHSWAVGQTGYDPSKTPPDTMPRNQIAQKSADYQRAMGACLDARGYSMR